MECPRHLVRFQTHCYASSRTEGAELQEQKWAASAVAKIVAIGFAVALIAACRARSKERRMRIGCQSWHNGAFEGSSKESGCDIADNQGRMRSVD